MKRTLRHLAVFAVLAGVSGQAEVLYDNTQTKLNLQYGPGVEFGDEIILKGTGSVIITNFTFEYFGTGFSGDEQLRVRFYENNGTQATVGGVGPALRPNTLLFDSDFFPVDATPAATLSFEGIDVTAPHSLTWTVEFSGLTAGESAGLSLYSPPETGTNYVDFWEMSPTGWQLRTHADGVTPMDFGAIVAGIPEPSTWAMTFIAAMAFAGCSWARGKRCK